jgi:HlyD family secretion protein
MGLTRKLLVWAGVSCVLLTAVVVFAVVGTTRFEGRAEARSEEESRDRTLRVKTVRPKLNDKELVRSVTQPGYVKGFFRAELMAHVAGPVKWIEKNIGDPVKAGEVLVELDVPDLAAAVAQKDALVKQAEQDARAAEANVTVVEATKKEAADLIHEKEALVERAAATKKYREGEYRRFTDLAHRNAVVSSVVDERLRDFEAAEADWKNAQFAVETTRANFEEFTAKLVAARVDVDVKKARVAAAQADRAAAQVMLDYAKVRAPFDGVIVARDVDPGAFVQSAGTGHATPLLTVVRNDVVTVVMWVPEKDTPYVTRNTEAVIHLDALGEREVRGKVTRFSNWLDPDKSRDMRVEVDVDNKDGLLKPGMYGTMKLLLEKFPKVFVVPVSTVFEREGKTWIFEVAEGKAHLVEVKVQLEDGVRAKIVKVVRQVNPKTQQPEEVSQELAGQEEILRSGQGEIADGQAVKAVHAEW